MTHCLIVFYNNCMKFRSNICNGFQLTERTRKCINDHRETNMKSRVMVLANDTLSHCALQLYEVLSK